MMFFYVATAFFAGLCVAGGAQGIWLLRHAAKTGVGKRKGPKRDAGTQVRTYAPLASEDIVKRARAAHAKESERAVANRDRATREIRHVAAHFPQTMGLEQHSVGGGNSSDVMSSVRGGLDGIRADKTSREHFRVSA